MSDQRITVVGAGLAGLAAARALVDAGAAVLVLDRGRVPGGRLASRRIDERPVDLGASYLTAPEGSRFAGIVDDWVARGLARPWTDAFRVADDERMHGSSTGPIRYAAPAGLRSLAVDLATGLDVRQQAAVARVTADGVELDEGELLASDAVVLAMPDPQARRLLEPAHPLLDLLQRPEQWEPVIAVALRWPERAWPADLHGVFVNDSPTVGFIADDGDRRGDGAPVLVAHTTPALARRHLDDPDTVVPEVVAAVRRILGIAVEPASTYAHRWTFARPAAAHDEPFALDGGVGVAGDGWGGKPSAGAAWTSGDALGRALSA